MTLRPKARKESAKEKMNRLFKKWRSKWKRHFAHKRHKAGRRKP